MDPSHYDQRFYKACNKYCMYERELNICIHAFIEYFADTLHKTLPLEENTRLIGSIAAV